MKLKKEEIFKNIYAQKYKFTCILYTVLCNSICNNYFYESQYIIIIRLIIIILLLHYIYIVVFFNM